MPDTKVMKISKAGRELGRRLANAPRHEWGSILAEAKKDPTLRKTNAFKLGVKSERIRAKIARGKAGAGHARAKLAADKRIQHQANRPATPTQGKARRSAASSSRASQTAPTGRKAGPAKHFGKATLPGETKEARRKRLVREQGARFRAKKAGKPPPKISPPPRTQGQKGRAKAGKVQHASQREIKAAVEKGKRTSANPTVRSGAGSSPPKTTPAKKTVHRGKTSRAEMKAAVEKGKRKSSNPTVRSSTKAKASSGGRGGGGGGRRRGHAGVRRDKKGRFS